MPNQKSTNVEFSPRYHFSKWPAHSIPAVAAGVYAIWRGEELIYCGMSGRSIEQAVANGRKKYGLVTRLHSHYMGRLSGDQFCVYVANRMVIPALEQSDLGKFASGELNLDLLTRELIRTEFEFQYTVVQSSSEAFSVERAARMGELFGRKPTLNPG